MSRSCQGGAKPLRTRPPQGWEEFDAASIGEVLAQRARGIPGRIEAFFERHRSLEIVNEGAVPRVRQVEEEGLALRWLRRGALRSASSDGLSSSTLEHLFSELLPERASGRPWPSIASFPPLAVPSLRELLATPRAVEAALRRRWVGLHYRLRLRWQRREIMVVADRWLAGPEREEWVACEVEREGRYRTWLAPELPDPERIADALLDDLQFDQAEPPPPGRYLLWLAPGAAAVFLHETLGHLREVDLAPKAALAAAAARRLAGRHLSAVEDPTSGPPGTERLVDDEGSICRARWLLREGRAEAWIADCASAELWPELQPGQGFRSCRHDPVLPRTYCLRVLPGNTSSAELQRKATGGLGVFRMERGTMLLNGEGFRFESGVARRLGPEGWGAPVGQFEIRGTLDELLGAIVATGNEVEFVGGWCAKRGQRRPAWVEAPALLLDGVQVVS